MIACLLLLCSVDATIRLARGPLHPAEHPDLSFSGRRAAEQGTYLVNFHEYTVAIREETAALTSTSLEHGTYIPHHTLMISLSHEEAHRVQQCHHVHKVIPFGAEYKSAKDLDLNTGRTGWVAGVSPGHPDPHGVAADLRNIVPGADVKWDGDVMSITFDASESPQAAIMAHPGIYWLEESWVAKATNEYPASYIQTELPPPSGSKLWDKGLTGNGMKAAVLDGGLDYFHTFFNDPSQSVTFGAEMPAHRKLSLVSSDPLTGVPSGSKQHGTHVSGTLAGYPSDGTTEAADKGIAFHANLYFYTQSDIVTDIANMKTDGAVALGVSAFSNSWEVEDQAIHNYGLLESIIDKYARESPDLLLLFAAGNSAMRREGNVGSPGTCKNVMTIGATENPKGGAGNFESIASFSSRGPTFDYRFKPDVTAPGANIVSSFPDATEASSLHATMGTLSGTSMATPLTAGTALLVQQYFQEGFYPSGASNAPDALTPSAALVKAILINSAKKTSAPTRHMGFGNVVAASTLKFAGDATNLYVDQTSTVDATTPNDVCFSPTSGGGTATVTIAWTDTEASPAADPKAALINDLDLMVDHNQITYYGGIGYGRDRVNTVESIQISTVAGQEIRVRVSGHHVPQGSMAYALVVSGDITETSCTASAYDCSAGACANGGTCTNNECVCAAGYYGGVCSESAQDFIGVPYNGALLSMSPTLFVTTPLSGLEVVKVTLLAADGSGAYGRITYADDMNPHDASPSAATTIDCREECFVPLPTSGKRAFSITSIDDCTVTLTGAAARPSYYFDAEAPLTECNGGTFTDDAGGRFGVFDTEGFPALTACDFLISPTTASTVTIDFRQFYLGLHTSSSTSPSHKVELFDGGVPVVENLLVTLTGRPSRGIYEQLPSATFVDTYAGEPFAYTSTTSAMTVRITTTNNPSLNNLKDFGFFADYTSVDKAPCSNMGDCNNNGNCTGGGLCECFVGFFGDLCELSSCPGTVLSSDIISTSDPRGSFTSTAGGAVRKCTWTIQPGGPGFSFTDISLRVASSGPYKVYGQDGSLLLDGTSSDSTTQLYGGSGQPIVVVFDPSVVTISSAEYTANGVDSTPVVRSGFTTPTSLTDDVVVTFSKIPRTASATVSQGGTAVPIVARVSDFTLIISPDPVTEVQWLHSATYDVILNVLDVNGNTLSSGDQTFSFSTPADAAPPVLLSTVPSSGQTNVARSTTIEASFSEPVTVVVFLEGTGVLSPASSTALDTAGGTAWTFVPPLLEFSTPYAWNLTATDRAGNAMSASRAFTTTGADTTAPVTRSTSPNSGSTGVRVGTRIQVTFSEAIKDATTIVAGAGFFDVVANDGTSVAGTETVTVGRSTLITFTPTVPLQYNTQYTANIPASLIVDLSGNTRGFGEIIVFTTEEDTVDPYLLSSTPADNGGDISTGIAVQFLFSEAMTKDPSLVTMTRTADSVAVAGAEAWPADDKLVFTPSSTLVGGAHYSLSVAGARDLSHNRASEITVAFTTVADVTSPLVVSSLPANGATGVALSNKIVVTFSERMWAYVPGGNVPLFNTPSPTPPSMTLSCATPGGTCTPNTPVWAWSAGETVLTIDLGVLVGLQTRYSWSLTGLKDVSGNAAPALQAQAFTTVNTDSVPPSVLVVSPVNNAAGVDVATVVTIMFSEAMVQTAGVVQFGDASGDVARTESWSSDGRNLTLTPTQDLAAGFLFVLTIPASLTDLAGNPLPQTQFVYFTTTGAAFGNPVVVTVTGSLDTFNRAAARDFLANLMKVNPNRITISEPAATDTEGELSFTVRVFVIAEADRTATDVAAADANALLLAMAAGTEFGNVILVKSTEILPPEDTTTTNTETDNNVTMAIAVGASLAVLVCCVCCLLAWKHHRHAKDKHAHGKAIAGWSNSGSSDEYSYEIDDDHAHHHRAVRNEEKYAHYESQMIKNPKSAKDRKKNHQLQQKMIHHLKKANTHHHNHKEAVGVHPDRNGDHHHHKKHHRHHHGGEEVEESEDEYEEQQELAHHVV